MRTTVQYFCFSVSSVSDMGFLSWKSCCRTTLKCQPDLYHAAWDLSCPQWKSNSYSSTQTLLCMCCITHCVSTHSKHACDIYLLLDKKKCGSMWKYGFNERFSSYDLNMHIDILATVVSVSRRVKLTLTFKAGSRGLLVLSQPADGFHTFITVWEESY